MRSLLPYDSSKFANYIAKLKTIASFSRLFSESDAPYIHYRVTENLYTSCLGAINVSRDDSTADAIFLKTGVGIKTFIKERFQKIAEFNDLRPRYSCLSGLELVKAISNYRNARIDTTIRTYGLDGLIYHYIVREPHLVKIFESKMNRISVSDLRIIQETNKKIVFTDEIEEYEFVFSKSTLYKKFDLINEICSFDVSIISDPIKALVGYMSEIDSQHPSNAGLFVHVQQPNQLIVPLYVEDKKGNRSVKPKSGLNIWNAAGRPRDPNEVYIRFPASLRQKNPDFFPHKEVSWDLRLPNGKHLNMKLCQANEKAIMSNPNSALGEWLLRDVLNLPVGQILTYDYLLEVGIDSIVFTKEGEKQFSADFIAFGD